MSGRRADLIPPPGTPDRSTLAAFVVAMALPFLLPLLPGARHDLAGTLLALALNIAIVALGYVSLRHGLRWAETPLALSYLLVVAILRDTQGGAVSGYGPLLLIPLLWIAMHGSRGGMAACIVGIGVVLILPVYLIGGSGYQQDVEVRRTIVWIVVAALVGPTVQRLVHSLRESELQYRSVFENVREVIFQTDFDGRWTMLNPAWTEITGHPVANSIGQPFTDFVHPDDRSGNAAKFEQLRAEATDGYHHAMRYTTLDGSHRWLEVWARRHYNSVGDVLGVTGTLIDITDRFEAERLKEQFFALISHELRTPLASIIGYLELLEEEDGDRLSPEGSGFVTVMQRSSQRLMRLIGDLLFAAQVEAGQLALLQEATDIASVVRHASDAFAPLAAERELDLRCAIDPDLGVIDGDPHRLGQVVDNLLSNALKFTPRGGSVELRLQEALGPNGELGVRLQVQDDGPGIPQSEQAILFERFQRASAADAQAIQGVGLGLAIVRAIVDGHGGAITLRSRVGAGTTFEVWLPRTGTTTHRDMPAKEAG